MLNAWNIYRMSKEGQSVTRTRSPTKFIALGRWKEDPRLWEHTTNELRRCNSAERRQEENLNLRAIAAGLERLRAK